MVDVKEDLTGRKFGRLTVIRQVEDKIGINGRHYDQWLCSCNCEEGKIKITLGAYLKKGAVSSCGCLAKEHSIKVLDDNREKLINVKKKENVVDLSGEYGIGWTNNTNREFYFDLEDYDKIKDYCWVEKVDSKGYSILEAHDPVHKNKNIKMLHLLGFKNYDHKNRNPLDNRKENLRQATQQENVRNSSINKNNTSKFIGVSWSKRNNKWRAYITIDYKQIHIGLYADKEDAIKARLNAEVKYFGEFAPQRHLFSTYGIEGGDDNEKNMEC